jgi:hypothetical protein
VPGQERAFLTELRQVLQRGDLGRLETDFEDVALGVLKCCMNTNAQIAALAFTILHDLIPPFQRQFQPSLAKIVKLAMRTIERGNGRVAAAAQAVLGDLDESFNVNELLAIAVTQRPIVALLDFVGKLLESEDAWLSGDAFCGDLLRIAGQFHLSDDVEICNTAGQIFMRVDRVNHSVVKAFVDGLPDEDRSAFFGFIEPYLPDLAPADSRIEVPKFSPKSIATFRRAVNDIAKTASEREWNEVRAEIYSQISESLFIEGHEKVTLQMIARLLSDRGVADYHKLLPGLLFHMKSSRPQPVDNIIVALLNQLRLKEFVVAVQEQISSPKLQTAQAAIELITRILRTGNRQDIATILPSLFPMLNQAFQSEAAEIRKAVVMCFVEMKIVAGAELDPTLSQLTKPQQKLISVYYSRKIST